MEWSAFTTKYPNTANLLPTNFMSKAQDQHHLYKAINRDRTGYLDIVEYLITNTPAQKIAHGSYQNSLHRKVSFSSFLSELRGYIIIDNLCDPIPADIAGGDGLPDLTCKNYGRNGLDIEVTRLSSWDKMDSVQTEIEDLFDGSPYTPKIRWLNNFHVIPYTHKQISANERFVDNILKKLQNINTSNPPQRVENYGIEIELEKTGAAKGLISTSTVRALPRDPQDSIKSRLIDKAKKQRGYRPLVIFIDSKLPFLDLIDIEQILHGTSTSSYSNPEPSSKVEEYDSVWGKYLRENGYLPQRPGGRIACIHEGDEGLFSENQFRNVAGVVFFDVTNSCHYVPNFYSKNIRFKSLYSDAKSKIDNTRFPNL